MMFLLKEFAIFELYSEISLYRLISYISSKRYIIPKIPILLKTRMIALVCLIVFRIPQKDTRGDVIFSVTYVTFC